MLQRDLQGQTIYFHTGLAPLFLRITCAAPGARAFFTPSVTSMVKEQRKPVKSHPTALTITSAVLISHKAAEKVLIHNVPQCTDPRNHPPARVSAQSPLSLLLFVRLYCDFQTACRLHAPPVVLTFYRGCRWCPCVTFTGIPVLTRDR